MSTDEKYARKWKVFNALSFLNIHVKVKRSATTSNLEVQLEETVYQLGE